MAVTAANLTVGGSGSGATSYATSSISPTANYLIIAAVANTISAGTATIPTVSGASMTWTQIVTQLDGANTRRVTLFRSLNASPGSGAITFDFGGVTQSGCQWSIDAFTGITTSGSNGANAIVQSNGNTSNTTNTGLAVTLSNAIGNGNATYGYIRNNTAPAISVGSGYTQLSNQGVSGNTTAEWRAAGSTTVDWTWASQSVTSVAAAIEIKAAASSGFFMFM